MIPDDEIGPSTIKARDLDISYREAESERRAAGTASAVFPLAEARHGRADQAKDDHP